MFGLMYLFGMSYNFANLIALPLVIGLAVDYGVYLTHRMREDPTVSATAKMKVAGKPVLMAALTTMAGIGAILLGKHQGAVSLGQALICGIVSCLVAAMVVLPSGFTAVRAIVRRPTKSTTSPSADNAVEVDDKNQVGRGPR